MTKTTKSRGRTGSGGAGKGRAFGNPPNSTRFKKGFSGNPTGRPKGSRNLATLFKDAAKHPVEAKINGKLRKITTVQATIMQLAANAVRGDHRATAKFLDFLDEFERRAAAAKPTQYTLSDADIEVLYAVHRRMQQCDATAD
jgi:Family of unknown function (DUF5681)